MSSIQLLFTMMLLSYKLVQSRQNVKLYINDCYEDLSLENYHNYTGSVLVAPPQKIQKGTSTMVEYEYARFPEFGSYLDGNINYYGSSGTGQTDLHLFINVNETGGVYAFITAAPGILNSTGCVDVPYNQGTLPSIIGIYAFFANNQTNQECKSNSPAIDDCKYIFQTVNSVNTSDLHL